MQNFPRFDGRPNLFGLPSFDKVELSERSGFWVCIIVPIHPRFGGSISLAVVPAEAVS